VPNIHRGDRKQWEEERGEQEWDRRTVSQIFTLTDFYSSENLFKFTLNLHWKSIVVIKAEQFPCAGNLLQKT